MGVMAAGCGSYSHSAKSDPSISGGTGATPSSPNCAAGPARPLSPDVVVRTFRQHGYRLVADPHPACAPQIVAQYVNIDQNADSYDAVVKSEGDIGCEVDKEPYPAAKAKPWRLRVHDDRDLVGNYEVGIANVICQISPAKGKEKEQVMQLAVALRALAPPSVDS